MEKKGITFDPITGRGDCRTLDREYEELQKIMPKSTKKEVSEEIICASILDYINTYLRENYGGHLQVSDCSLLGVRTAVDNLVDVIRSKK